MIECDLDFIINVS